jgi:hypothetical protein
VPGLGSRGDSRPSRLHARWRSAAQTAGAVRARRISPVSAVRFRPCHPLTNAQRQAVYLEATELAIVRHS